MTRLPTGVALAVAALGVPAEPWTRPPLDGALDRLVYDHEVAAYCGLVDGAVDTGYRRRLAELGAGLDPAAIDRARANGWKAARWEWQNRGLGGFRGWCRSDGVRAADRLRGYGTREDPPTR